MLCTPWQLAQLATVCEPAADAKPWYEASKLTTLSAGIPNLLVKRTLPWHRAHVSGTLLGFTSEARLVGAWMECSPWQSVQTGA